MKDGLCVYCRVADGPGFRPGVVEKAHEEGDIDVEFWRRYDVGECAQDRASRRDVVDKGRDGDIALGKRLEIETRHKPKVVCSPFQRPVKVTVGSLVCVGESTIGQDNLPRVSMPLLVREEDI